MLCCAGTKRVLHEPGQLRVNLPARRQRRMPSTCARLRLACTPRRCCRSSFRMASSANSAQGQRSRAARPCQPSTASPASPVCVDAVHLEGAVRAVGLSTGSRSNGAGVGAASCTAGSVCSGDGLVGSGAGPAACRCALRSRWQVMGSSLGAATSAVTSVATPLARRHACLHRAQLCRSASSLAQNVARFRSNIGRQRLRWRCLRCRSRPRPRVLLHLPPQPGQRVRAAQCDMVPRRMQRACEKAAPGRAG